VSPIEKFALLFDFAVVVTVVFIARRLRRGLKPLPLHNWRPSDDDARSGRRITLFIYPKGRKTRVQQTHR
jgi:hypothetical protein